ncbi:MAG: ABC-type transport auxiliary lipoprotein family protein [Gammaproteobacteria bacterium]|nr:ABC-type transport auxiliary lipoprotein family protein [Gammaproteobacteria bacterium]
MRYGVILLVLVLSACSSPAPAPQDHFYRLPAATAQPGSAVAGGVLLVEPLKVSGLIRERSIVYIVSEDSVELERYHYHLWHESPGYMLQRHLANYLRRSGFAETVTTAHSLPADMVITGDLHQFMQIHDVGNGRVMVSMELRLQHADSAKPVIQKIYTEYEPVDGKSMADVIAAFSRALNRIYNEFAAASRS